VRVLGIDPGLRRTGYGCVDMASASAMPRVVEAGVIRLRTPAPVADRLAELAGELRAIIEETRPDRLAVEQVFSHADHVRTAILMAHARGVVLLCGAEASLPLDELAPAEVKRAVAGSGRATKEQMQEAVRIRCGLQHRPEPNDVADALAIAMCAGDRARTADLRAGLEAIGGPVAAVAPLAPRSAVSPAAGPAVSPPRRPARSGS
jgi:crossover junction endodeoxyribonuclease RuvC